MHEILCVADTHAALCRMNKEQRNGATWIIIIFHLAHYHTECVCLVAKRVSGSVTQLINCQGHIKITQLTLSRRRFPWKFQMQLSKLCRKFERISRWKQYGNAFLKDKRAQDLNLTDLAIDQPHIKWRLSFPQRPHDDFVWNAFRCGVPVEWSSSTDTCMYPETESQSQLVVPDCLVLARPSGDPSPYQTPYSILHTHIHVHWQPLVLECIFLSNRGGKMISFFLSLVAACLELKGSPSNQYPIINRAATFPFSSRYHPIPSHTMHLHLHIEMTKAHPQLLLYLHGQTMKPTTTIITTKTTTTKTTTTNIPKSLLPRYNNNNNDVAAKKFLMKAPRRRIEPNELESNTLETDWLRPVNLKTVGLYIQFLGKNIYYLKYILNFEYNSLSTHHRMYLRRPLNRDIAGISSKAYYKAWLANKYLHQITNNWPPSKN